MTRSVIKALGYISGMAAGGAAPGAGAHAAEPPPRKQNAETTMSVNLPLLVSDRFVGDLTVEIDIETNRIQVKRDDAERLLGERLDENIRLQLFGQNSHKEFLSQSDFAAASLHIVYDPTTLEIRVSFPTSAASARSISLFGGTKTVSAENSLRAPNLSGSIIFNIDQSLDYRRSGSTFEPLNASAEISLAIGGEKGIFAFSDLTYDGRSGSRFRRGKTWLIHDDQPNAIRYSFGDIVPQTDGFQSAPSMGGFGVERSYQSLQPNRNIRPAGLFRFAVEEPSLVDIVVNGSPVRTLRLERGQYDIRDFNFVTGLNAVEIFARDEFGRRSIARFDQFFDFGLLAQGINEFGFYLGAQQRLNADGHIAYQTDDPIATGYFRAGVTSAITAGINAQSQKGRFMFGGSFVAATPVGSVALVGALSRDRNMGAGSRFLVSYQHSSEKLSFISNANWNLEAGYTSASFNPVGNLGLRNDIKFDLRARANGLIGPNLSVGVSASYATRRGGLRDTFLLNMSASRRIGPINFGLTAEHVRSTNGRSDSRFLVSLGMQLGQRGTARASFDTRGNIAQLDASRFKSDVLGDWGGRATVTRDMQSSSAVAEASYNQNRALFTLRHAATGGQRFDDLRHRTSFNIATQLSFTGDRIGFGRPVGHNFVLAYPHESLPSRVELAQGVEIERIQARSGALGPALGSAGTAYTERRLTLRAPDAPPGYDIGPGYYTVMPLPAGGYAVQLGSDAFYSVSGTLVDDSGQPVQLLAGTMRSLDRPEAKSVSFFTNRAGRFVAVGLVPGRHRIEMGQGIFTAEIDVAVNKDGSIDLGIVRAKGAVGS
jgi:outer membrane usher protein